MQIVRHQASVVSQILSARASTHSNRNLLCHQCWRVKPNKGGKKRIRGYLPEGITLLKHKQGSVRLYWWKKEIRYNSSSSLAFYSSLSITGSGVEAVVFFPAGSGFIWIKTRGDVHPGQGLTHWDGDGDNSWTKLEASTVGIKKKPHYLFFDERISIVKMGASAKVVGSERLPLPKLLNKKKESYVQLQAFSFNPTPLKAIWLSLQPKCSICFDPNQSRHNYCHISFVAAVLLTQSKLIINEKGSLYCPRSICCLMDPGWSPSSGGCFGATGINPRLL